MFSLIAVAVVTVLVFAIPLAIGIKTGRLRILLPCAVVVTALVAWFGWAALGEAAEWDSAKVHGDRALTINYTGSECEDYHSVSIDEDEDSVTVSIKTWEFATGCSDVGSTRQISVKLDRALGDRQLIDGSCRSRRTSCTREVSR